MPPTKSEVGTCGDCEFLERKPYRLKDPETKKMCYGFDRFCGIFDVYVPVEGFCHNYEPANSKPGGSTC